MCGNARASSIRCPAHAAAEIGDPRRSDRVLQARLDVGHAGQPLRNQRVDECWTVQRRLRFDGVGAVVGVRHSLTRAERLDDPGHGRSGRRECAPQAANVERVRLVDECLACAGRQCEAAAVDVAVHRHQPGRCFGLQPLAYVPAVKAETVGQFGRRKRLALAQGAVQAELAPDVHAQQMECADALTE